MLGKLNNELLLSLATDAAPRCARVDAAVAYAEGKDHPLLQTCREYRRHLTLYALLDEDAAASPALFRELLSWGPSLADARLVKGNFHAKVVWWRGYGAYVGSANLTDRGWFHNLEAGIFLTERDLAETQAGAELERMFDHLSRTSIPVTAEIVEKLERLAKMRRAHDTQSAVLQDEFRRQFRHLPDHPALTLTPPKQRADDRRLQDFATEWTRTLQLLRGLSKEFAALGLRPAWVRADAHPAIHFDQFLHAYYYDFVRSSSAPDDRDEDDLSTIQKIEANFSRNRANPSAALKEGASWWAKLPTSPHGEELFIRETAPAIGVRLSEHAVAQMDLVSFQQAFRNVHAFRMHARHVNNSLYGLPAGYEESQENRVNRLCAWLWDQRTETGKQVREVLAFVIWGTNPADMERRLWLAISDEKAGLPHLGQSALGEAVGWARPDDYPPRNDRTNKALRALGHDVKLFAKD